MSGITTGTALLIGGLGAAAGDVTSGVLGANAAGNAASTQANSANQAANLQYQESQNALDFQKTEYNQSQANEAPWLQAGANSLSNLQYLLGVGPNGAPSSTTSPTSSPIPGAPGRIAGGPSLPTGATGQAVPGQTSLTGLGRQLTPLSQTPGSTALPVTPGLSQYGSTLGGTASSPGVPSGGAATPLTASPNTNLGAYGSLLQPYGETFQAPTSLTEQNDPGYQARLALGDQSLQQSAAARGSVLTGGTAKALDTYGQDYASNEYNQVYNRALTGYTTNYNAYQNQQNNEFNRLAALSGVGQTAANQLSSSGQAASNNVSSNLLSTGQQIGQDYQNAGAATASGYVGAANAYGGAVSGAGSNLQNLLLLQQLQGQQADPSYDYLG